MINLTLYILSGIGLAITSYVIYHHTKRYQALSPKSLIIFYSLFSFIVIMFISSGVLLYQAN